jgi:hypothetical protein
MKSNESHAGVSRTTLGILIFFALMIVATAYIAVRSIKKTSRLQTQSASGLMKTEGSTVADGNESGPGNRRLETKLALLNARQSELEDDVGHIEDRLAAAGNTDESGSDPLQSAEEQENQAEQKYLEQVALLDRTLSQEQQDPAWSRNADDQIHQTLMETGVVTSVKSVCQSTFCRVDIELSDETQAFQDLGVVGRNLPWNGQTFVKADTNTGLGTIYLAREGFELPKVEQ